MPVSERLLLPLLDAAQAQKHVTHNEALAALDALVQLSVSERNSLAPAATPVVGTRVLVGAGATGAFLGRDGCLAAFGEGGWSFFTPRAGWLLHVAIEGALLFFDGTSWSDIGLAIRTLENLTGLGIGTTSDSANAFAAKLNATLFTAKSTGEGGSGDLRLVLNKVAAGNTVSTLFQSGYAGRAEMGLAGSDDFAIKVSADGSTWHPGAVIDAATGFVHFPSGTSAGSFPAVAGEQGVVDARYRVGDLRRYGIAPDGVDLTGLGFAAGSTTVTAPAGTFVAALIGTSVCSPCVTGTPGAAVPTIVAVASNGTSCTLSAAAVATASAAGARVGTFWERDHPAAMAAVAANAALPNVSLYVPPGKYVTTWNWTSAYSGAAVHFDHAEFSGVLHLTADSSFPSAGAPLSNIRLSGDVTLFDRFGATGLQGSDLSALNVRCRSDATKNITGVVGRGVHLYLQVSGTRFGEFVIDDCGVGTALNTDGAFVVDSSDCDDLSVRRVWVKDSAGQGVLLYGANHAIGELRVDAWGYGAADRQIAETASLAQSQDLCGIWLKRCPGLTVGTMRIGGGGTARANARYTLRVEDTANGQYLPPALAWPRIERLLAAGVGRRGISVGDRVNAGLLAQLSVGTIDVTPTAVAGLDTGYSLVHVNANASPPNYGRNGLTVENLICRNPSAAANDLLQVAAGTFARIGAIGTTDGAGQAGAVLAMNGCGHIGRIDHLAVTDLPATAITWNPDGPSSLGPVDLDCVNARSHFASGTAVNITAAGFGTIGPISVRGSRPDVAAIRLAGASGGVVRLGTLTGYVNLGTGVSLVGCTGVRIEGGSIGTFALGTTGSGNTRCTMLDVACSGNTTDTDLAHGQAALVGSCLNATL